MFGSNSCSMRSPCRWSGVYRAPSTASNSPTISVTSGVGASARSTATYIAANLHHAHPEHLPIADINIVFAREVELAVGTDAEHGQAGGHLANRVTIAHRQAHDVRRHKQPPARIDVEIAAMDAARIDVLDRARLAGYRVQRKHRQRVLAADEHLPAAALDRGVGAVRDIGEAAVRVHLVGADRLTASDVAGLGQGAGTKHRFRRQHAASEREHVESVLPLQHTYTNGFVGWKSR